MPDAILVTGASGFVGSHLVAALRAEGRQVFTHSRANGDIASGRFDVASAERVGHVVHLAGRSFVPESWQAPRAFYEVNVVGTVNVLDFCRPRQVPLTYVSSYVYGIPRALPIAEDHPLQALNPYGHTKILAEEAVRFLGAQFGLRTVIVRPFNIYGPGQDPRFLIPTLIAQALDPGADAITVRDVRPKRDFLHVRDLVSLLVATLSDRASGIYNAGSGRSVSIPDLVGHINAALPAPKPLKSTGDERPQEVFDVVADVSRARRDLSWAPAVALDEGVGDTVRWMQAQPAAAR